ncbi:MAG: hypothetical protein HN831_02955 [Waddliaceae bacterium]|nr:hypothetical protein [Waddliaceae bacterium]
MHYIMFPQIESLSTQARIRYQNQPILREQYSHESLKILDQRIAVLKEKIQKQQTSIMKSQSYHNRLHTATVRERKHHNKKGIIKHLIKMKTLNSQLENKRKDRHGSKWGNR